EPGSGPRRGAARGGAGAGRRGGRARGAVDGGGGPARAAAPGDRLPLPGRTAAHRDGRADRRHTGGGAPGGGRWAEVAEGDLGGRSSGRDEDHAMTTRAMTTPARLHQRREQPFSVTEAELAGLAARLAHRAEEEDLMEVAYRIVDSPVGRLLLA